ncbi:hypothetical protein M426DRAFT_67110 [Hypoxylon sp. CI-4A]|nr:hypothetical protein M426DRAFT_67110 [Hypoxylon sp. CI-4A]
MKVFAVKRLRSKDKKQFDSEVESLKRFSNGDYPHIIRLLATYRHGDHYHLIFPCAEGNLKDLWKKHPRPTKTYELALWIAGQAKGIAEGLRMIHNDEFKKPSQYPGDDKKGRHGDIKPENILWFQDSPILVLSDFGLGSMHHDRSKSYIPNKNVAATPGFRPPECDMKGGHISRAFDVWTLGCLFLDLLCWLLGGDKYRGQFETERTTQNFDGLSTSIYFEVVGLNQGGRHGFTVKEEVKKWFAKMHRHPRCTQFVHDFLDLIETKMLIVETEVEKRARTKELLDSLERFNNQCKNNTYCFIANPDESRLGLTSTVAEGSLSGEAKHRISKSRVTPRKFEGQTQIVRQSWEQGDELMEGLSLK